jgi:hypothetical protein
VGPSLFRYPPAMNRALAGASASVGLVVGGLGALILAMAGFSKVALLPTAWVLAVCSAALHAGVRHGTIWLEHRTVASVIAVGNLLLIADLLAFGPARFAPAPSVEQGRPATIGITGYQLALDEHGTLELDIGPEPSTAPKAPYISIPDIPSRSEGTHATNSPVHIQVSCADEQCSIQLTPTGIRRDFTLGIRGPEQDDWQIADAVDIPPHGHSLRLREHTELGGSMGEEVSVEDESYLERSIPIEIEADHVRFGDCEIPFAEEPIYVPVLEFRFIETSGGCRLKPITAADQLHGRWLERAPDGSIDIPAHSFFEITAEHVRWFPLENHNLATTIITPSGDELAATPPRLDFLAGETLQLALFRREFRQIRLPADIIEKCEGQWAARIDTLIGGRPTGCRQLKGYVKVQRFAATVETELDEQTFVVRIDRRDPGWGHRLFIDIPPSSWTSGDLEQPRRHVMFTGRWPQGTSFSGSSTQEEFLAMPLRLHGTTPYRAVITLDHGEEDDGVVLRIADASRRGEVSAGRAELTLGPPGSQALVTYEYPATPWRLAQAALWPTLAIAIALAALSFATGLIGTVASRVAAVGSTIALIAAYGLLQKSLVAYSIVVHSPHDWKALDQLLVSALLLPAAIGLAGALAVLFHRDSSSPRDTGPEKSWVWPVLLGLLILVTIARAAGSFAGREAIDSFRFVLGTPWLASLYWMCTTAAQSRVDRRWFVDLATVGVGGALVLSWWTDKGAMLLLGVPVAMAMIRLVWHRPTPGRIFTWVVALGFMFVFLAPMTFIRAWSRTTDDLEIPALSVAQSSSCEIIDDSSDISRTITEQCMTPVSTSSALEALDNAGVLDTSATISGRRHPLRRLDWMEDGAQHSECDAIDRFPTRDAIEVGYFRALVERYRSEQEPTYLREELLPAPGGVTKALLDDYVGVVAYLPQMPRGAFSASAFMLVALFLLTLGHGRPWRSLWGAAALGSAGLLLGASILTVAANLDAFPNFAQSIPFLALRSFSALALDTLAVFAVTLGLALHTGAEASEP